MIKFIFAFLASTSFAQEPVTMVPEWKPNFKWSGDMRYRFVGAKEHADEQRKYQQIRARLGLRADVNEVVQVQLRLATGTSAVSVNQTVGDSSDPGMPRRFFGLDQAFISWRFLNGGTALVGRTSNPFWAPNKSQLAWDSDLTFEGLSFMWESKWSHSGMFINLGSTMISENYQAATTTSGGKDSVDTGMAGAQLGYLAKQDSWSGAVHVANYYFLNVQNSNITRFDKGAKLDVHSDPYERYRGNRVHAEDPAVAVASRKYLLNNQYQLIEAGIEFKYKIANGEIVIFADAIENQAADDLNRGHEIGLAGKLHSLTLSAAHMKREADSVLGAITDSDMSGGGTDNEGFRVSLGWEAMKNTVFQIHQYVARRGIDSVNRSYSSTFVDLQASF